MSNAPAPTISRPGVVAEPPRKLFVNIPVSDLQRSISFFEALGFSFNPQYTDATATCMLVGEDAYMMLLTEERFVGFSKRPVNDRQATTAAIFAFAVDSREAADQLVARAIAAGGSAAGEPLDMGFMYNVSFRDPDGHVWEAFWMDPAALGQ